MSGALLRIIYVAAQHKKTLASIVAGIAGVEYERRHSEVKRQLEAKGVPHREFDGHPSQVPDNHHYWHV